MSQLSFKFFKVPDSTDNVCELADRLTFTQNVAKLLKDTYSDAIVEHISYEWLNEVLSKLTMENAKVMISGKNAISRLTDSAGPALGPILKERWLKTKYQLFNKPTLDTTIEKSNFRLPAINELIPTNFDIFGREVDGVCHNQPPKQLNHDLLDVWFSQDCTFKMPRVILQLIFFVPDFCDTPIKRVTSAVFIDAFLEIVSEQIGYQANMADVVYSCKTYESNGLKIKVKGYNHKLENFIVKLVRILKQLGGGFDPKHSVTIRNSIEKKIKEYRNLNLEIDKHTNNNRLLLLI